MVLSDLSIINITEKCARECIRQHVSIDRVATLLQGYHWALKTSETRLPTAEDALKLAGMVEPDNHGRYRITPVTFLQSTHPAASASAVPGATNRLFSILDETIPADEFVRSYLSIHPLSDGNGRTAFVLYNWIRGTLVDPAPLPDWEW